MKLNIMMLNIIEMEQYHLFRFLLSGILSFSTKI